MWGAHEGMGWWMLFGSVFWLIVIVAVVYAAAVLSGRDRFTNGRQAESALDIARRRYAAGEISEEDLRRIRENLES